MNQNPHRHSLLCILPPEILRAIAQRSSSAKQRQAALSTLAADHTLRSLRVQSQQLQPARTGLRATRLVVAEGQKRRTLYDAKNEQTLPGVPRRTEGAPPTGDPAVDEAYDGFGATFDFYWEVFQRNSIDDEGLTLEGTVHFGREYDNAFWNGERMVFGDGDGDLFNRFTVAVDVIGHELTHGVVDDEARLIYMGQPGALNESMADVFGSMVKQRLLKQTAAKADWLIGEGLLTKNVQGKALRSMKEPGSAFDDPVLGKDPQPGHMKDFKHTFEDNGGVHVNSGIPNRAFALAAQAFGGYSWEKAGRIWYEALRDPRLRPNSGFRAFAQRTLASAARLFGDTSNAPKVVSEAWREVGVEVPPLPSV